MWDRVICDFPLVGRLPFWSTFRVIWLVVAAVLGMGMLDLPYGLYTIVRFVGAFGCGLAALVSFDGGKGTFAWIPLSLGCLLYQPLIRIPMDREFWVAADGVGCVVFFAFAVLWAYPNTIIEDLAKEYSRRKAEPPPIAQEPPAAGPDWADEILASYVARNSAPSAAPPVPTKPDTSDPPLGAPSAAAANEPTVGEQLRAAMDKLAADRDRAHREAYREWRENKT
jgi:hypothetical protein